jgi:hypothetical protein
MVGGDRNHSLDLSEFSLMIQKIATAEWKKTELTYICNWVRGPGNFVV